jgi:geranylgeranylglycerol-phosphate geranylgeranyltransferase
MPGADTMVDTVFIRGIRIAQGLVSIIRPGNVVLTALSVLTGAFCAVSPVDSNLMLACIAASLIGAGGYVLNDVFDVAIDRINRPDRPLPRGTIPMSLAILWAIVLVMSGLGCALVLGGPHMWIAFIVTTGLVVYAAWMKRTAVVGHVIVATISGLCFVYGGLLGPNVIVSLAPAVLAAAFHLGREFLKAAADREGDLASGARTLAVTHGTHISCVVGSIPLIGVVILSPLPVFLGWFGWVYLLLVVLFVDSVLMYVVTNSLRNPDTEQTAKLVDLLKWDMVAGLLAIWSDICFRLWH